MYIIHYQNPCVGVWLFGIELELPLSSQLEVFAVNESEHRSKGNM